MDPHQAELQPMLGTDPENNGDLEAEDNSGKQNLENNGRSVSRAMKGIVGMCVYVMLMTASVASVQLLERRIPDLELNVFRCGTPLVLYFIGMVALRRLPRIKTSQIIVTAGYTVVTFGSSFCQYVGATWLPIANEYCVIQTTNIVGGMALFALFWTERISPQNVIVAVLCICGVVLVMQPWASSEQSYRQLLTASPRNTTVDSLPLVDSSESYSIVDSVYPTAEVLGLNNIPGLENVTATTNTSSFQQTARLADLNNILENATVGTHIIHNARNASVLDNTSRHASPIPGRPQTSVKGLILGVIFSVLSGISYSLDILLLKKNPFLSENLLQCLFWCLFSQTGISLILTCIIEEPVLPGNMFDIGMVTIHCLACTGIWPLFMYTPQCISGNTITIIMSTSVVFMLLTQYTVLSSILPGHRNWQEVMGMGLVLIGSIVASILETLTQGYQ